MHAICRIATGDESHSASAATPLPVLVIPAVDVDECSMEAAVPAAAVGRCLVYPA